MLGLAIVVPKANRTRQVLSILVPLAIVLLAWFVLARAIGGNSSDRMAFGTMVQAFAVGCAALWLLAHCFAGGAWYGALLKAFGVGLSVALVGGASLGFGSEGTASTMVLAVAMVSTVAAYALAVRGYRSRRVWLFLTLQAVGTAVACLAGTILAMSVFLFIVDDQPFDMGRILAAATGIGLILSVSVFLAALPYSILGLSNPFFHERLLMCASRQSAAKRNDQGDRASSPLET